jgi:ParB-like chromosome segregation protein Spo0J
MSALEVSTQMHRVWREFRWMFEEEGPVDEGQEPVSILARMLALAHRYQALIDSGEVHDQAELARRLRLSRNRVSQILSLTLLSPDVQEDVLRGDHDGLSTRELLTAAQETHWQRQRARI